jgi:hypothetical protein
MEAPVRSISETIKQLERNFLGMGYGMDELTS